MPYWGSQRPLRWIDHGRAQICQIWQSGLQREGNSYKFQRHLWTRRLETYDLACIMRQMLNRTLISWSGRRPYQSYGNDWWPGMESIYPGLVIAEASVSKFVISKLPSLIPMEESLRNWPMSDSKRVLLYTRTRSWTEWLHPCKSASVCNAYLHHPAWKFERQAFMWRRGIHRFLELRKHRLPSSSGHNSSY